MKELLNLYLECFPEIMKDKESVERILTDPENHIIQYRDNDKLIGYSVINENTIYLLCVSPDYRNQGYGTRLLEQSEQYIQDKGEGNINEIQIGAGKDYIMPGVPKIHGAHEFFAKRGYEHSWGDSGCFDMSMSLEEFQDYEYEIGDTIRGITYRLAVQEDKLEIISAVKEAYSDFVDYYQEEDLYKEGNDTRVLIGLDGNAVCGAIMVGIEDGGVGNLGCTVTSSQYRGKGIASTLVQLATKYMKEQGLSKAYLEYTYTEILSVYRRSGYEISMEYFMAVKEII